MRCKELDIFKILEIILEDFLEDFFWRIFGRIFLNEFFVRNFLFTLVCQDFGFCQDFVSIKKEGGGQEI